MADQETIQQVADLNLGDVVECTVVFKDKTERRYSMAVTEVLRFQGMLEDEKDYGFVNIAVDGPQSVTIDTAEVLAVELGKKLRDAPEAFRRKPE